MATPDFDAPGRFFGVCSHCAEPFVLNPHNDYMLQPALWLQVHPEGKSGYLHDVCLEARCQQAGVQLDADSFTRCLCYVNRRIHYAEDDALQQAVAERADRNLAARQGHGRRPLDAARNRAHLLRFMRQEDAWACRPARTESPFAHLFP